VLCLLPGGIGMVQTAPSAHWATCKRLWLLSSLQPLMVLLLVLSCWPACGGVLPHMWVRLILRFCRSAPWLLRVMCVLLPLLHPLGSNDARHLPAMKSTAVKRPHNQQTVQHLDRLLSTNAAQPVTTTG